MDLRGDMFAPALFTRFSSSPPHEEGSRVESDGLPGLLDCSQVLHSIVSVPIPFTY